MKLDRSNYYLLLRRRPVMGDIEMPPPPPSVSQCVSLSVRPSHFVFDFKTHCCISSKLVRRCVHHVILFISHRAVGPATGDITTPPICPSVLLSINLSVRHV